MAGPFVAGVDLGGTKIQVVAVNGTAVKGGSRTATPTTSAEDVVHEIVGSVRLAVSAAEPLPAEIFRRWKERFGVEILDGIGSTEVLHIYLSARAGQVRPGSTGQAAPGYELALIDDSEATLKYFRREGAMVRLDPANRSYDPQRYAPAQVRVQGKLAGLLRRYD